MEKASEWKEEPRMREDMSLIQDRFIGYLPENALILVVGCGSGRDSLRLF